MIGFSKILSIESKYIKIKQEKKDTISSGWIDFNEHSIGLTYSIKDEDLFTEIRYMSVADWYLKGNEQISKPIQSFKKRAF